MHRLIISSLILLPTLAFAGQRAGIGVRSSAFANNGAIPSEYTCDGSQTSPPMSWSKVPAATKSIAILVVDPDAPKGTFTHWLVTGLDPTTTEIGKDTALPSGAMAMKNDTGNTGYAGPCPPSGMHHYRFQIFALDIAAPKATTRAAFLTEIKGHTLATGYLVGTYEREKQ